MRTTVVVLVADSRVMLWGHIGDSRLYHFEEGQFVSRTQDHSLIEKMVDAGEVSPAQARHHQDRNRLLRCLGDPDSDFEPTILDHSKPVLPGTVVLLCTDGFWEHVTEEEMALDLAKAGGAREWLEQMEGRLLDRAPEGHDNYAATAVLFGPVRPRLAAPLRRPMRVQPPPVAEGPSTVAILLGSLLCLAAIVAGLFVWRPWQRPQEEKTVDQGSAAVVTEGEISLRRNKVEDTRRRQDDMIHQLAPIQESWASQASTDLTGHRDGLDESLKQLETQRSRQVYEELGTALKDDERELNGDQTRLDAWKKGLLNDKWGLIKGIEGLQNEGKEQQVRVHQLESEADKLLQAVPNGGEDLRDSLATLKKDLQREGDAVTQIAVRLTGLRKEVPHQQPNAPMADLEHRREREASQLADLEAKVDQQERELKSLDNEVPNRSTVPPPPPVPPDESAARAELMHAIEDRQQDVKNQQGVAEALEREADRLAQAIPVGGDLIQDDLGKLKKGLGQDRVVRNQLQGDLAELLKPPKGSAMSLAEIEEREKEEASKLAQLKDSLGRHQGELNELKAELKQFRAPEETIIGEYLDSIPSTTKGSPRSRRNPLHRVQL